MSTIRRRGLYVSYNDDKNGAFDEAVTISNALGCLTWLDKSTIRPEELQYPADIFIRLTGREQYYRGILLAVLSAKNLHPDFVPGEHNHRPSAWRNRNQAPKPVTDFGAVFYISRLQAVERPLELANLGAPQHPTYVSW